MVTASGPTCPSNDKASKLASLKLLLSIVDLNNGGIIASSTYNLPSPWADPPIQAPRSGLAQIAYAVHEASMIGKFRVPSQKAFSKKFERELTFGTDDDAMSYPGNNIDPRTKRYDMSNDPKYIEM